MTPSVLAYLTLGLAIVSEVTDSSLLQKTEQFSKPLPTILMALCFAASLFFLAQALKVFPLGIAYAIWGGLGIVITSLISVFVYRSSLDAAAIIGIALVVTGVVVMNIFSRSASY